MKYIIKYFAIFGILFLVSCKETATDSSSGLSSQSVVNSESGLLNQSAKSDATVINNNIYRHLTAVRTRYSDKRILGVACVEQLGFRNEMTPNRVIQGRQIEIPIDTTVYNPTVNVTRSSSVQIQPPPSNGLVFKPQIETVYRTSRETLQGAYRVVGTCIGSEYITE